MGTLGSILYIFMWAKTSCDVKSFEAIRHIIVGTIIGFVYYYLHTDYNFPNGIMTLVAGYMGPDFVEALIEHFNSKFNENDKSSENE
jgi:uncharacterized membrane protein YeaQ/YmgE (transglycosylase-associated protein family)